jgi:phosphatidylinositol glycan class B
MFSRLNLIFIGLVVFGLAAYFSGGHHHPDEHFQILEFADYKRGITTAQELPWEFREQIRPGLQPLIAYTAGTILHAFGVYDPFMLAFALRLFLALLTFLGYVWLCRLLEPDFRQSSSSTILLALSIFVWYMPYVGVRFSSENGSAAFFLAGIALLLDAFNHPRTTTGWRWWVAGLLFGLSFFLRYQIGFALVGLMAWLVFKRKSTVRELAFMVTGGIAAAAIGVAADYWLYGQLVCTPWNYFRSNVLQGRMLDFGIEPWWFYFPEYIVRAAPPMSVILLVLMGWGIYRKPNHVFTWFFVPFVLAHILIKHKELRFMFPMAFPLLFLVTAGWEGWIERFGRSRLRRILLNTVIVINILLMVAVSSRPTLDCYPCFQYLYYQSLEKPRTVYAEKESPYLLSGIQTHFYDPPNLTIVTVDQFSDLADTSCYKIHPGDLLLHRRLTLPQIGPGIKTERVFTGFPDWLLKINIGGWQERSRIWSVYEVKN